MLPRCLPPSAACPVPHAPALHACNRPMRCSRRGGISHSPAEHVSADDVAAATASLYAYLRAQLLPPPAKQG